MDRELKEKLKSTIGEIKEINNISTFLLIKRIDTPLWDIVLGGPNLDNQENIPRISKIITKHLTLNEVTSLSRLVLLNSTDGFIINLRKIFRVDGGDMELKNANVNGVHITHAYLLYCK